MEKLLLEHLWIVIAVLLLTLPLKAAALWRAARRGHIGWFLTIIILNTLGIFELLYIFIFSKWGLEKVEKVEPKTTRQPDYFQRDFSSRPQRAEGEQRNRPTII
jgi:methionyl-tRNA synthetase